MSEDLMLYVEHLRSRGAIWVVNTGRTISHVLEGLRDFQFASMPDFVIAQETHLLQPNPYRRWTDVNDWNRRCVSAQQDVKRRGRWFFRRIRKYVAQETQGAYLPRRGAPDEICASTEEEMNHIVSVIEAEAERLGLEGLGYQRNSVYLRFGHEDFSKGTTLAELGRHLGLGPERIFAAGDNYNDLSMLTPEVAHALACPANALPVVKEQVRQAKGFVANAHHGHGMVEALGHFFFT